MMPGAVAHLGKLQTERDRQNYLEYLQAREAYWLWRVVGIPRLKRRKYPSRAAQRAWAAVAMACGR